MSEKKWTPAQQNAINADNGTLLLSAAAGSGKTAVLVERIIRILTDESKTTEPENLLVVTFTNAAAAEMRQRTAEAIDRLISENPENTKLNSIRMKLSDASIGTMDSFCIKTVRENYHLAGIEPDFRVLDDSELTVMQSQALNTVTDRLCKENKDVYDRLVTLSGKSVNDYTLKEKINKLYNISLSYPYPEKWLDEICSLFTSPKGTQIYKSSINSYSLDAVSMCGEMISSLKEQLSDSTDILNLYSFFIEEIEGVIKNLTEKIQSGTWNDTVDTFGRISFTRLKPAPKAIKDDTMTKYTKSVIDSVKNTLKKLTEYYCATDEENEQDNLILSRYIKDLCDCVKSYSSELDKMKKEAGAYGFSDFLHKTLNLFIDENGNKTPVAEKISNQYHEIMIDEYQDTNDVQDMLFEAISRNGDNIFTVGDVKQSIYSFRMARPELFVKKSEEYKDFDGEKGKSKIILSTNFRSRKGVIDGINYIFNMIMCKKSADIDYNENEKLNFGNTSYGEDETTPVEMHITDGNRDAVRDAFYISRIISEMINNGETVTEKNGKKRKCRYGDFCILLRSLQNKSDIYAKTLNEAGIPAYAQKKESLFDTTEINLVLSLLSAVDNPSDDVSVLSAMHSPVFGFTPDEIARIKINRRNGTLFSAIKHSAQNGNEHCKEFVEKIEYFKDLSISMPLHEYVNCIIEDTAYPYIVNAMTYGDTRKANLYMFCEFASDYEMKGGSSVSGFIRFILNNIETKARIPSAADISENADVVKILSIHKSKGLEYPFVIIADCGKEINYKDTTESLIIDSISGAGMKITDLEKLKIYPTLSLSAAKINARKNITAEEMRILYVAMTRAREKLITVSCVKNPAKKINEILLSLGKDEKINPFIPVNATSYFDWLVMAYLRHPDSRELRKLCDSPKITEIPADFKMKFVMSADMTDETKEKITVPALSDSRTVEKIREKAEFVYPYEALSHTLSKHTASEYDKNRFSPDYFAKSKPPFMYNGKLSPAQIGTANHLFLQLCDFDNTDIESQINELVAKNKLTKEQGEVINKAKITAFLKSDICSRMKKSDCLMREKQFAVFINAEKFDKDLPDYAKDEKIFVQGMTDAVFCENGKAYIVDYKTDVLETEELFKENYSHQLGIYKIAIENTLNLPVDKMYIYSLHLNKTIEIK